MAPEGYKAANRCVLNNQEQIEIRWQLGDKFPVYETIGSKFHH